jgi:hypothetical protein
MKEVIMAEEQKIYNEKQSPNRYLTAFLFGKRPFRPDVYAHFAYRFRSFKNDRSVRFFNWHAWFLSPFYLAYRRLGLMVFKESLLWFLLMMFCFYFKSLAVWLTAAVIWAVVTWFTAYQADYASYKLYLNKMKTFKALGTGDYDELVAWGGGRPVYCVLTAFWLTLLTLIAYLVSHKVFTFIFLFIGGS